MNINIVYKRLDEIKPYDNNPRVNDGAIDAVANSIREFGFKNPIIVDKDGVIVCGHTRRLAALKLGLTDVPCVVASDLTPDQIRGLRVADNKTSELSTWDLDKLTEELKLIDIDMAQFGFEDLLDKIEELPSDDEFDVDAELNKPAFTKKGDIYILGKHRVMCGDSTVKEDVDRLCDNNLADMIFTDLPYNVDYEGKDGMKIQNDNLSDEAFKKFLELSFTNLYDHVKKGGSIYCCHADSEGLNFRSAMNNAGFKIAECIIWVKNSLVLGRQDYHWRHEPILYGWKEGAAHYFINDRTQDTVWEYDKPRKNDLHPTMKPLELVSKAIKNSSKINDIVLDLFGGSGSTLISSEGLKRIAFLMELDEKYTDVIVKRYISNTENLEECFLIRNEEKIPLNEIKEFNNLLNNELLH